MTVTRADVDRVLNAISRKDVEALRAEDYEQFQFQGFDPIKLASALLKIKNNKTITESEFFEDVFKMVAIGMIKGSVNEHNLTKMSDEGKNSITTLNTKYGIKLGGGQGQASDVITYPRVMATFPDIAVRMSKVLGPKDFPGGPMLSSRLPDVLRVQVFPSTIPKDLPAPLRKMLLTASLCYSIDQTIQISKMTEPDLKAVAGKQSNFVLIGHNSPVPSTEIRRHVFKSTGLSSQYDAIASVLTDYKSKIDSSFAILSESEFKSQIQQFM